MNDSERGRERDDADAVVARREHCWETDGHVVATVAEALADAEDEEASELTPSLYDRVDPSALDTLFGPRDDGSSRTAMGRVVFDYDGYRVVVTSGGRVEVREQ